MHSLAYSLQLPRGYYCGTRLGYIIILYLLLYLVGILCESSIIKCGGVAFEKLTSLSMPRHASERDIVYTYICVHVYICKNICSKYNNNEYTNFM